MTQKDKHKQIVSEKNTYFSSLISQKQYWTIEEILSISKDLLSPFKNLKENNIEPSIEVSMLYDTVYLLPYKLECYKSVVNALYKNMGMACEDLTINVFNADCGIDSIAFINALITKGYKIEDIKTVRLFSSSKEKLKRAVLLHKKLYASIPLEAYNMDIKEINDECRCNSLFTINLFAHTFNLAKDVHKEISRIIIGSHYIYSHSIFFENISSNRMPQVSDFDCNFYWQDLNICRFYKNDSHNFSFDSMHSIEGERYYAKYAVFSNLSFETLDNKHEYQIVLNGLCPGVPNNTLFNQKRTSLFFDRPFQNKDLCNEVDNTNIVMRAIDYNKVWDDTKVDYTLRKIIEEFPQYSISEGLNNDEEWAHEVFDYYLNAAENGNAQCYNNIGVLKSLCNELSNDSFFCNNLSNKAKDFFKVLKLKSPDKNEPAFVTYNRICALYNGIKNGNDSLKSDKALALKQLKKLAKTECLNWPDWEIYVWSKLALWTNDAKESSATYSTYWIKASKANPNNSCAYRTNMALFSQLDEEEVMAIWHEYAYGNGCETCHECSSYDKTSRCCPKAQFNWARKYEKDKAVAKFLMEAAMRQGYNAALQYLAVDRVKDELLPNAEITPLDNFFFNRGIVPSAYRQIIPVFTSDCHYKLLCRAADNGSKKAAALLREVSKLRNSNFEKIYWSALTANIKEQISILQKITNKDFANGFFRPSNFAEQDLITISNKRAEQFIGEKEDAFAFLKTLAEFYVRGEMYSKAVELYKIAASKGFDVSKRINELEEEIEQINKEYSYDHDYDYYEEPDYAQDTWDAMTDGMYGDMPEGFDGDYSFLGY